MDDNFFDIRPNNYKIPPFPEDPVVAMAYVPFQNPVAIFSSEQGLEAGTLFPCLDKPFCGCGVRNK